MMQFMIDDLSEMNEELRAFAEFLKKQDISEEDIFSSRLISCELITNVIRHCGECARFEGSVQDGSIHIKVSSPGTEGEIPTRLTLPDVFSESGRGLYIVNTLCQGHIDTENGTVHVQLDIKGS